MHKLDSVAIENSGCRVIALPRAADPTTRLRVALASVQNALADQRRAVGAFRDSLAELRHSVDCLRLSLTCFDRALEQASGMPVSMRGNTPPA